MISRHPEIGLTVGQTVKGHKLTQL